MITVLDFEKPIFELEKKISELKNLSSSGELDLETEVKKLETRLADLPFPVHAFHHTAYFSEPRRKKGHDEGTGTERHRLQHEGFGLMNAHTTSTVLYLI